MTHPSDREKLIEEAANAVRDAWQVRTMRPVDERPGLAETAAHAALTVFEHAHAPTDDERDAPNISVRYAFREGYESGFRDGEIGEWRGDVEPQGEPSDAQVEAAQQSLLSSIGWVRDSYVRDALHAAFTAAVENRKEQKHG